MKLRVLPLLFALLVVLGGCAKGGVAPTQSTSATPSVETANQSLVSQSQETPSQSPTPSVTSSLPIPEDSQMVVVKDYIPSVQVELKYATANNFVHKPIYTFTTAYLRYGTVKKLQEAQKRLEQQGYGIKIWDAFRPVEAQFALWEAYPDPAYVANPNGGYSSHSKGNTVDITLVDKNGNPVEMPTGFDDFSQKANRDYSDCTPTAAANATLLEETMLAVGFTPYYSEWWHFSDTKSYEVEKTFAPKD